MRIRKNYLWVAVAALVIAGGMLVALLLRMHAAPDAVRLLPECDAVVYINLAPVRLLTDLAKSAPKERDPQYEEFVRQTGFEFERDLEKAAFAIHYGAATPASRDKTSQTRYSEILQGHFDSARVSSYLHKLASSAESYQGYEIYSVPVQDRTVRVVLLGVDLAAASNTESSDTIYGIIDRYRRAALPFAGPTLVSQYYARVPLGSVVWTIARPPASSPQAEHGELLLPGGWSGLLPADGVVIASARPLNDLHLRADVITRSEAEAQRFTQQVDTYLVLFKSLEISMDSGGPDKDVKAAFDSLEVHQDRNEAVLTAKVPFAFFKKMLSEPPVELGPEPPPTEQRAPAEPQPAPKKKGQHR
ncbi:MAG TPA: hypothetical protein VFB04_01535 [Terriglobales bacterium]|nr:hypothetical protein [Terriglobales bacterium]